MTDEIFAKLVTVEKLLVILLSQERFEPFLRAAALEIHEEFGERLSRLFPSDAEFPYYSAVTENFNRAISTIEANVGYRGGVPK